MIIHAGDFTYHGEMKEVIKFLDWYRDLPIKHKILICGNHEVEISRQLPLLKTMCQDRDIRLLDNQHITIEGIKIFGSPYSVKFGNWAFGLPDKDLSDIWDLIDQDTDIIVTHGPAFMELDECPNGNVGSKTLASYLDSINYKLHITGHIHEGRGTKLRNGKLTVNASICGIPYTDIIVNPITVEL